jgi:hypothetical protein
VVGHLLGCVENEIHPGTLGPDPSAKLEPPAAVAGVIEDLVQHERRVAGRAGPLRGEGERPWRGDHGRGDELGAPESLAAMLPTGDPPASRGIVEGGVDERARGWLRLTTHAREREASDHDQGAGEGATSRSSHARSSQ